MSDKPTANRLTLDIERSPDVAFVRCRGELVAGVTDLLYREVRQLMPDIKRIVLDLKDLTYVDSSGLGTLVRLYVSAKFASCNLEFINISGRIRQILGVTNLLSVLQIVGEHNIRIH
jgi:anti-sigma B factor antagonist